MNVVFVAPVTDDHTLFTLLYHCRCAVGRPVTLTLKIAGLPVLMALFGWWVMTGRVSFVTLRTSALVPAPALALPVGTASKSPKVASIATPHKCVGEWFLRCMPARYPRSPSGAPHVAPLHQEW